MRVLNYDINPQAAQIKPYSFLPEVGYLSPMHTLHSPHFAAEIVSSAAVDSAPGHVPPITHYPSAHSWRIHQHDSHTLLYEDGKDNGLPVAGPSNYQARTQPVIMSDERYRTSSRNPTIAKRKLDKRARLLRQLSEQSERIGSLDYSSLPLESSSNTIVFL